MNEVSTIGAKVLLVEDNRAMALLLKEQIDDCPEIHVHFIDAGTLREAVQMVAAQKFNLILLDLTLPDSRGIETLKILRAAAPPVLPIIVLTCLSDQALEQEALRSGAALFLPKGKPGMGDLLQALRNVSQGIATGCAGSTRRT